LRILGIDPGSRTTGFGIIEISPQGKLSYIASGTLSFEKIEPFMERLQVIYRAANDLVEKYRPDTIGIESLIHVKNVSSLAKLAQARGALIAGLTVSKTSISEYAPNQIKAVTTGHGHTDKGGIQKMIQMLLGVSDFITHDESDALAIAICHSLNCR